MSTPPQALLSVAALERVLSPERFGAYRNAAGDDDTKGLALYLWNLALANALQPALHVLEVAFRNEIGRAAAKLTANRNYSVDRIPSWLDAVPSMLMENERRKIDKAKKQLGNDPRSQTEGHLIAKLDFGFWVALCRHSYADTRSEGPRLWPRALTLAFRPRPKDVTTPSQIFHRFDRIRRFRNRVAHHEPIWDRDYLAHHEYIVEGLGWMSPRTADAVRVLSPAPATHEAGYDAFLPYAETILGTGLGLRNMLEVRLQSMSPQRRSVVSSLMHALMADPELDPATIVSAWSESYRSD